MAKKKKAKTRIGWRTQLVLISALICSVVFSSMSVIMAVGMIPTIVCGVVDRSKYRLRTWTVGAMNFAGCAPFMMEVWKKGATIELSLKYISEPRTVVVMFFAASMGYVIDWAMTGMVSSIMVQRGKSRLKDIHKQQKELVERWGAEITGLIALDEFGFPKDDPTAPKDESAESAEKPA